MKKYRTKINLFILSFIFINYSVYSQQIKPGTRNHVVSTFFSTGNLSIPIENLNQFTFNVKKGHIKIETDFGGNYTYGSTSNGPVKFDLTLNFDLNFKSSTSTEYQELAREIKINNENPEGLLFRSLNSFIYNNNSTGFRYNNQDIEEIEINSFSITDNLPAGSDPAALAALKIYLTCEVDYAFDPDKTQNHIALNPLTIPNTSNPHVIDFSWSSTPGTKLYPDYQMQLLRLYNEYESSANDEATIQLNAPLDWSKALVFETESDAQAISLLIGEGTGYYAWRVRPIGTYDGGIANDANWGEWNNSDIQSTGTWLLDPTWVATNNNATHHKYDVFFFNDPDRDKNYIYSRSFTEGNKMSEKKTYATVLNQVKQTQVYLPSKNTSIVTQSAIDFSGRTSITTLPVPVDGGLSGYKTSFFQKQGGDIFRAIDFDEDGNYMEPPLVDDGVSSPFSYYSNQNLDQQIPDAQKYPYTKTIYENDGSNRVKEQSGAGERFMVDDDKQTHDRGRTVRTFYETPSQDELIAIFGDEAPSSESVFKTITLDQNNTASVTFTNKEGKVIATGLTFADISDQLEPVGNEPVDPIHVNDKVTKNVNVEQGKFVSTKKLTVLKETEVSIDYKIKCQILETLCSVIELDCGFHVYIIIHNPDGGTIQYSGGSTTLDYAFTGVPLEPPCNPPDIGDIIADFGSVTLSPGNYIIEKILKQEEPINVTISENTKNINDQIQPITNWITSTLALVDCEPELMMFYNDLWHFAKKLQVTNLTNTVIDFNCNGCSNTQYDLGTTFQDFFNDPALNSQYDIHVLINDITFNEATDLPFTESSTKLPVEVYIQTPCCSLPHLSVLFTPDFRNPTPDQLTCFKEDIFSGVKDWSTLELNTDYFNPSSATPTEYFPDFEGYAISMIKQCWLGTTGILNDGDAINKAKQILYNYMRGWHLEGIFNQMAFHMVTDEYNCDGYPLTAGCTFTPNPTCGLFPQPPTPPPNNGYNTNCESPADNAQLLNTQYKCSDLSKCWKSLVLMIMQQTCPVPDVNFGAHSEDDKISEGFDKQNKGDESKHDNHVDDNFDIDIPWPFGWFMEQLMSSRLRDRQDLPQTDPKVIMPPPPPLGQLNLANMFLNCTGYRFADIIDNGPTTTYPNCSPEKKYGYIGPNGITYDNNPCFISLESDFDANPLNGEYNPPAYFLNLPAVTPVDDLFGGGPLPSFADTVEWRRLKVAPSPPGVTIDQSICDMFGNIRHPVYAFKYYDYEYGLNNNLEQSTCFRDPNKCKDAAGQYTENCCGENLDGTTKLCYFCGIGYIHCDKTKENWSCGQRYSFFEMLKGYKDPKPDPFTVPDNPLLDNCDRRTVVDLWYDNPQTNQNTWSIKYLSAAEWLTYYGPTPHPTYPHAFKHLNSANNDVPNVSYTPISLLEAEAAMKKDICETNCDDRKEEFRAKVIKMFTDRCYIIGGCKADEDDNVVPLEDIDAIVESILAQCKSQCSMTTWACEDKPCRDLDTPPTDFINTNPFVGADAWKNYRYIAALPQGMTASYRELKLGVGGDLTTIGNNSGCPSVSPPLSMSAFECTSATPTFAEYTAWLQAREWDFDLRIHSKCNDAGVFVMGGPGGHIYVTGVGWSPEAFDFNLCGDAFPEPNTKTSIERSLYVTDSQMPDPLLPPGTSVPSTKVGLTITTP